MKPISEHIKYGLQLLQKEVHDTAVEKGWYETERSIPELIALMHSELSEALEEYRSWPKAAENHPVPFFFGVRIDETGKPVGFGVELADCIIRILDTAEHLGIDLGQIVLEKHKYNKTRPHRHGGKLA